MFPRQRDPATLPQGKSTGVKRLYVKMPEDRVVVAEVRLKLYLHSCVFKSLNSHSFLARQANQYLKHAV